MKVNQVISYLTKLIDIEIHRKMQELTTLGRAAKGMALKEKPISEIEKVHSKMFKIFSDLSLCEIRVRELYPSLVDLFNLFEKRS